MVNGITSKLVKKDKVQVWSPPDLDDPSISDDTILETWTDPSKSKILAPAPVMGNVVPSSSGGERRENLWGMYRVWGLPTEEVIRSYVDGSAKSSGAFALTEEQLKEKLIRDLADKLEVNVSDEAYWQQGVRDRVKEVVERCCVMADTDSNEKYLKWAKEPKALL